MNKTQEALKMAIEAMSCISQSRGDPLLKAINACKEALKQPAQEPVAWTKTYEGKPYSNALVFEKPENDPDGWYPLYLHPQEIWNDKVYIWQVWDEKLGTYYFDIDQKTARDIPLYIHPHQWQGLTDDEIHNIADYSFPFPSEMFAEIFAFARAIEQAHGISAK